MVDIIKTLGSWLDLNERVEGASDDQITRRHLEDLIIKQYSNEERYPKRQRSLRAIDDGLGGYFKDPQDLKSYLIRMRAEPIPNSGTGPDQEWTLSPEAATSIYSRRRKSRLLRVFFLIVVLLSAMLALVALLKSLGIDLPSLILERDAQDYSNFAECINDRPEDKGISEWRIKCANIDY